MARPRGDKWLGDRTYRGERQRKTFDTKAEAEAWEQGIDGMPKPRLDNIAELTFERRWAKGSNTRNVKAHIEELCRFFTPGREVSTIGTPEVEQFKSYLLLEKGNSGATVNRKLATLSSILDCARRLGYVTKMPELDYEDEGEGKVSWLTDEDINAMRTIATHGELHLWLQVFNFLLETGCRYSEMANATVEYQPTLHVVFTDTKNGKDRSVPLTRTAMLSLLPVGPTGAGKVVVPQMPYDTFHRLWQGVKELSPKSVRENPEATPHILRHTCATRLVKAGVPLYTVAKWLGHRSIKTTERYAHLSVSDLDVALAALER